MMVGLDMVAVDDGMSDEYWLKLTTKTALEWESYESTVLIIAGKADHLLSC